jgi:HlyD family secretion protein
LIQKQIENNIIKAPIDGRITEVNSEVGEQVVSATPVINLLADNNFEIEVYISESDISKIKVGNKANITFDAFGDDYKISGQVYFIDPAATSISDVIYYKIKINFSEDEISKNNFIIKSGMTANVDIIADYKENVFAVSSRAILVRDNGEQYIRVLNDETVSEITVTTGINGDQSKVEIFSEELQEGSLIITSTVTK